MTIIVETTANKLDMESAMLEALTDDPLQSLYALGATQAINWIRHGAKSPSDIIKESKSGAIN